jgi:hypothetical protein
MRTRKIPQTQRSIPLPEPDVEEALILDGDDRPRNSAIGQKNAVTGWKLLIIGLLVLNLVFGLLLFGVTSMALSKSLPLFVTKGNGETDNLEFFTGNDRSPALIKFFAEEAITNIYTWRNTLPEKGNPPDLGVMVEGGKKIPTTAFRYSLALEPVFAKSFQKELGELVAITQSVSRDTQTAYVVEQVGEPEIAGSGKWKIKVIGHQLIQPGAGRELVNNPINLDLLVRAVPPPTLSSISKKYEDIGLAKAAAISRAKGLEIINITNIK